MIRITKKVYDELVKITEKEKPNEAFALLFKNNTIIVKGKPRSKSSVSFDNVDAQWILKQMDKYGNPSAVFHSHPCEAVPSGKDMEYMQYTIGFWNCIWLIMSDKMKLRGWTLNRRVLPEEVEVIINE